MKKISLIIFVAILFLYCTRVTPTEEELRQTLNKKLMINLFKTVHYEDTVISFVNFKQRYKFLSVVFLKDYCSPCYPKFIDWQTEMDSMITPNNYTILFVIQGNSYSNFMTNVLNIKYVEDKFYTIMDPEGQFLEANKEIPRWIIDSSILIDSENKIKMVGAPFATPEMTDLFHEICAK